VIYLFDYSIEQNYRLWIISEYEFEPKHLNRIESLYHQANGYMGIRAANEEQYLGEKRGMFVSGTFNKFDSNEVPELPNVPDLINIQIEIDGEILSLCHGDFENYEILLNLKSAALIRQFTYKTKKGASIEFYFQRLLSVVDKHVIAQKIELISDRDVRLKVKSGIDGTITNTGVQHFRTGEKRMFGNKILQCNFETTQSKIKFCLLTGFNWFCNRKEIRPEGQLEMSSRTISMNFAIDVKRNEVWSLEKISSVHTSLDKEWQGQSYSDLKAETISIILHNMEKGFAALKAENERSWNLFWKKHDVVIKTNNPFQQIAIRYAILQIAMMTPGHDNRMNIGAKGLSGESYKGHTFWDTEIYLLPFWIATEPKIARSLLEYRYLSLDGARKKAVENGYKGAMYPWESAWITDGEVTPKWGDADISTGYPLQIICGDIEQHITADVAYGVWYYYQSTGDDDFMEKSGYEIIFETATFWQSRWNWDKLMGRYVITDVIGPDEYKEHINNNAFTNYMSHWNVTLAIEYYEKLERENKPLIDKFEDKFSIKRFYKLWKEKVSKLYLPQVNQDLILPQDDLYLHLPEIPIERYKNNQKRAEILKEYNMHQISRMQISKQADVLMLMYLRSDLFSDEVKEKNFYYYEPKCLHDSSLSYSIHSIMASEIGDLKLAGDLFQKALSIDLNNNPLAAAEGIHAASMGGIWQCIVNGFAGIRLTADYLQIAPRLPDEFESIKFGITWRNVWMNIFIEKQQLTITPEEFNNELFIYCDGQAYTLDHNLVIKRNNG
jgi:hypothetical glycosyl hydrolase